MTVVKTLPRQLLHGAVWFCYKAMTPRWNHCASFRVVTVIQIMNMTWGTSLLEQSSLPFHFHKCCFVQGRRSHVYLCNYYVLVSTLQPYKRIWWQSKDSVFMCIWIAYIKYNGLEEFRWQLQKPSAYIRCTDRTWQCQLPRKESVYEQVNIRFIQLRKRDIPGHHLLNLNGSRDPSQIHNGWLNTDTPTPAVRIY
jgi:hypothetical protein